MSKTAIAWADEVRNPVVGCSPVSPGCNNCYAAAIAHRGMCAQHRGLTEMKNGRAVFNGKIRFVPEALKPIPGKGKRVFIGSMCDLFHTNGSWENVHTILSWIAKQPQHIFMVLTKRPENMRRIIKDFYATRFSGKRPIPNLWLGVTAENQERADERIPILLQIPAAVRFVSVEPMLGEIDLRLFKYLDYGKGKAPIRAFLNWVISGCESGPHARHFEGHEWNWARSLRDQCVSANVPFFLKQMPKIVGYGKHVIEHMPELNGQVWAQVPEGKS
jgi:protein gp37